MRMRHTRFVGLFILMSLPLLMMYQNCESTVAAKSNGLPTPVEIDPRNTLIASSQDSIITINDHQSYQKRNIHIVHIFNVL